MKTKEYKKDQPLPNTKVSSEKREREREIVAIMAPSQDEFKNPTMGTVDDGFY